jgi:hypothetical protein
MIFTSENGSKPLFLRRSHCANVYQRVRHAILIYENLKCISHKHGLLRHGIIFFPRYISTKYKELGFHNTQTYDSFNMLYKCYIRWFNNIQKILESHRPVCYVLHG